MANQDVQLDFAAFLDKEVLPKVKRPRVQTGHGAVEVVRASGRVDRQIARRASGHPGAPLSDQERLAKFWALSDFAGEPIRRSALEAIIELTGRFEEVASTSELTSLLAAPPA